MSVAPVRALPAIEVTAEHHNLIRLGGTRNLTNHVDSHLVLGLIVHSDIEGQFRRDAVLEKTDDAVVLLRRNGNHRRWNRILGILRATVC